MRNRNFKPGGVWSATPTPFTKHMKIDKVSVKRLVEHHLRLGVNGIFLCGTCGEGPWMPDNERREMIRTAVEAAQGRLPIAVQVTDNSAARILDNMRMANDEGADMAVIAPPFFPPNSNPANVTALYKQAIRACPLPVGIYDRGCHASVQVTDESMLDICSEPKVIMIKDSSMNRKRMKQALRLKKKRPDLRLLNGYEFACPEYIQAGYDGLLLGGGIFNGRLAGLIIDAVRADRLRDADKLQARMNRLMWDVYGGKGITCWISGLKHLLVRMGVFRTTCSFLNYPLTAACRRAIERAIIREKEMLLP